MVFSSLEVMKKDLEYNQRLQTKIKKELRHYKKWNGKYLVVHKRGIRKYYYVAEWIGHKEKQKYLGKADHPDVVSIQEAHFLREVEKICEKNIECLRECIGKYQELDPQLIVKHSGVAYEDNISVGKTIFGVADRDEWRMEGFKERERHERPYKDELIHIAGNGERMRTKGEVIIANILDMLEIPYVYEWPRVIQGVLRWPDFTLRNPRNGKILLIEYMGKYGDEGYRIKNNPKIEEYFMDGYVLGQNLLIFMDDEDGNMDAATITSLLGALR